MAAGWKEAYEAGRCEECGEHVQRRQIVNTGAVLTLDVHQTARENGYVLTPDGKAYNGATAGLAYQPHYRTCRGPTGMQLR